jgi:phage tail sheath protein FI
VRYTQRLRAVNEPRPGAAADPAAFDFAEARALSYGAVYFPWLSADVKLPPAAQTGSDGAPPTRRTASGARTTSTLVPPDGAALGVLAGRASDRGAWVGAANQPLRDVVALFPPIPASDRLWLQEARINLVRDDPRGFLTLSASTLAEEPELVPINVRRLLTLLRRLALRRGQSYVFEPHGPALRRAVERGFDVVLTELFRRGAFAGATAEDGFRVVVDDTVNPPASVEAGRLVVELRIAPSRPLTFLTVRLAQSGPRLSITEEL